ANAIYNLADLGVKVFPVGVVGDDEAGRLLLERFREKKISTVGIVIAKGRTTVTKTRILAGMTHTSRQQGVRVDREPENALSSAIEHELTRAARKFLREADALLISDYGYGAATPALFDSLRANGTLNAVPVALDSRYRILEYQGITAATPNEPEVEDALRVKIGSDGTELYAAGKDLLSRMKLESLVITRGRDGMVAFSRDKKPVEIPIQGSDQVADVTGAGDTVIATYTAALAVGADAESAARLANFAGGIVVMKRGTATVTREELLAALEQSNKQ